MVFPAAWYIEATIDAEQMRAAGVADTILYWMRIAENAGRMGLLYLGEEAGNCSDALVARWMNAIADGSETRNVAILMLEDIHEESRSGVELLRMMMNATALTEIQRGTEASWLYSRLAAYIGDNDFRSEVRHSCSQQGAFHG